MTPILTRAFDPSVLGAYQLALAIALVLQPLATLRVEFALPVTRDRGFAIRLVRRAVLMTAAVCALFLLVGVYGLVVGMVAVTMTCVMSAALLVTYATGAVDTALLIRSRDFKALASRNVLFGLLTAALQLGVVFVVPHVLALALSIVFGRLLAVLLTRSRRGIESLAGASGESMYGRRRMFYAVLSALGASSTAQGLPLFLGATQSVTSVGYISVAQRITTVPAAQLAQAFTQLLQIETSQAIKTGERSLAETLRRPTAITFAFAVAAGVIIAIAGPPLVEPMLGPGWDQVADLLPILAVLTFTQLLSGALSPVLALLAQEHWLVAVNFTRLILSVGGAAIATTLSSNITVIVAGFTIGSTLAFLLHMFVVLLGVRRFDGARKHNISDDPDTESTEPSESN
ncbi:lipopolysaccharide biosynthesis protein [Microbacterium sp. A196]|uniref:lipopolysaccharide biosynthesis protein n=1 Tax=Microbacterium sp. A196 TaxID=3457320 RepID=UPI003FD5F008